MAKVLGHPMRYSAQPYGRAHDIARSGIEAPTGSGMHGAASRTRKINEFPEVGFTRRSSRSRSELNVLPRKFRLILCVFRVAKCDPVWQFGPES